MTSAPGRYERRILRVLDHVEAHLDGDLDLDQLADVAALSRFHFHRVFRALQGETVAQAVRRLRLERAARLLLKSDLSLNEIAKRSGYPNPQSFSRIFRSAYGATPSDFRRSGAAPPRSMPKGPGKVFPVEIHDNAPKRLAAIGHEGAYAEIGATFEKLAAMAASRNLWDQIEGMVGVYYDDPQSVPADKLRSHAGLVLKDGAPTPEGLEDVAVEGGRCAVLTYKGPYAGIEAAYHHLYGAWLEGADEELRDAPCYEIYLNSPREVKPEDLLTQICMPLAG